MDDNEQMLKDCEDRESKLTDWERSFIDSLQRQWEVKGSLSPRQAEVLEKIWERVTSKG